MKILAYALLIGVLAGGCGQKPDCRIELASEVASDSLLDSRLTRPIAKTLNHLFGDGIEIRQAFLCRNEPGFLELQVKGFNRSYNTKQFQYKVEWFDENQCLVHSKTDTWLVATIKGKSEFAIDMTSPSSDAVDFKMETKKAELIKAQVRAFKDVPILRDMGPL